MSKNPTIEEIERRREARRPLVDKISSKLPKYFKSKLNDKHGGGVTQFGSKFYFNPVPYIRYTFSTGEVYMMNQPKVIKEIPINEDGYTSITFYNIMDDVEMHFDWEPRYVSSASYFDIDHMVIFNQDLGEEVVKVGYNNYYGLKKSEIDADIGKFYKWACHATNMVLSLSDITDQDKQIVEKLRVKYNDLLECHVSGVESSYSDQYNQRIKPQIEKQREIYSLFDTDEPSKQSVESKPHLVSEKYME